MSYGSSHFPMATAVPVVPLQPDTRTTMAEASVLKNDNEFYSKSGGGVQDNSILQQQQQSNANAPPPLRDDQIQQLLQQGYTRGLAMSMDQMKKAFALRIWIVDNSGSMQQADGHRIVPTRRPNEPVKLVPCTRWEEIAECVDYHIQMADLIQAPTRFRLLNPPGAHVGPQQFSIAESSSSSSSQQQEDVRRAQCILRATRPGGCTPLTAHILEIHHELSQMAPALRQSGQKVVLVIATDGLPTDERGYGGPSQQQEFVHALRLLEGLPVWVVVRLCTDEENVVNFYNELDGQLELSLEVLDDFCGEAEEVKGDNPWLNYALPLHRLREMGYHDRVMDMLDERALTTTEIRDFCSLLFGRDAMDGTPDPAIDWDDFIKHIQKLLRQEMPQYDPIKKQVRPWMDLKKLDKIHGEGGCTIM